MAVNSNLAALMRVIEDIQDKIPEGEYLQAMNALGALHREIPVAVDIPVRPVQQEHIHVELFAQVPQEFLDLDENNKLAFRRVKLVFREYWNMKPHQWIEMSEQERANLNRQSVECMVEKKEANQRNPNPSCCPFIARHSIGSWRFGPRFENNIWTCVCGYSGKVKQWQKHEKSERHQNWSKHRTVSKRIIDKMKRYIADDEAGDFIAYKPYSEDGSGIRCFTLCQEKNEWTHPELFLGNIAPDQFTGKWFVYNREPKPRQYEQ